MGLFHHESDEAKAHDEVNNWDGDTKHEAHLSHQLIAAAASYEAAKAYKDHCEKNGKPVSHAKAKEFLAAASGAFIERIVETKGLDFIDQQKAKHHAKTQLEEVSSKDY